MVCCGKWHLIAAKLEMSIVKVLGSFGLKGREFVF
jgi:hypothetical protein